MDLHTSAIIAVLGTVAVVGPEETLELFETSKAKLIATCLAYFCVHFGTVKIFKVFVYPQFLSPLRNVPGPKVRSPFFPSF